MSAFIDFINGATDLWNGFNSFLDNNEGLIDFGSDVAQSFQQEGYADDLREVARMLFDMPNQAGLNNSWEQISPIISPFTDRVNSRFDEIYNSESNFLNQVDANLSDWLASSSTLNDRLTALADRPAPEFMRPEYIPPIALGSLSEIPGFDLASKNMERAVGRAQAAQGYGQSGNILNAVAENLGQLGLSAYRDEMNRRYGESANRYTTDVGRYNADISAYNASVDGAVAPLRALAENMTSTISSLSGLRSNTASGITQGVNAFADFNQGVSGDIMNYLARAQTDRAGLFGSIAESVGQLYADAALADRTRFDQFGRQGIDNEPRPSNGGPTLPPGLPNGPGAPSSPIDPSNALNNTPATPFDLNGIDVTDILDIANPVIDQITGGLPGLEFNVNDLIGSFSGLGVSAADILADPVMSQFAGPGGMFTINAESAPGFFDGLSNITDGQEGNFFEGISNMFSGGEGANTGGFLDSISNLFSGGGEGTTQIGNLMNGFNNWFSGAGGTMAGFALPAGLFARASMQSSAERNSANRLADNITNQIDQAARAGRSTVNVNIAGQRFNLRVGPRGAVRQGRWFQLADGRWVGIGADGKNTPIVSDRPPNVSSTTNTPSYVQNNRTEDGPQISPWAQGLPYAMPGETMAEYQARMQSSSPMGDAGGR